jgi:hypothetical protein
MGKGKSSRRYYEENFAILGVPIPWDDFVYILTHQFGFEVDNTKGGSGFTFTRGAETFTAYRPHKKGMKERYIHKADRQKAIRALRNLELI